MVKHSEQHVIHKCKLTGREVVDRGDGHRCPDVYNSQSGTQMCSWHWSLKRHTESQTGIQTANHKRSANLKERILP